MKKLTGLGKRNVLIGCSATLAIITTIVVAQYITWPDWTGISAGQTTTEERDANGNLLKKVTTYQDGKTLWDWLSILGVPFSLTLLGFLLQQLQQKRADEQNKLEQERVEKQTRLEKEIAEANQREEALQSYLDRLSTLLVDKNLAAIAASVKEAKGIESSQNNTDIDEKRMLLDAATNVIQARTLSILRRLGEDAERKSSVIRFLCETRIIDEFRLNLFGVNLSGADLTNADLSGASLPNANLSGANLSQRAKLLGSYLPMANLSNANLRSANALHVNLSGANLSGADLSDANPDLSDLSYANLSSTKLVRTQLKRTNLKFANFSNADLSHADIDEADLSNAVLNNTNIAEVKNWTELQLSAAKLCKTKLPQGCNLDPNRDCKDLGTSPN